MASVEVTFYTHPSSWVNGIYPDQTLYNRVSGIAFENEELWADTSQLASENSYSRTDTEALTLSMPREFALPVVEYFHDFYADPPRFYKVSEVLNDLDQRSNCHRFGASVLKKSPQDFFTAYGIVTEVAQTAKCTPNERALGDLAVLAFPENPYEAEHPFAAHTMVSLGNSLPDHYIHTVALGGNLAISPLEPFVDSYREESPTDVNFHSSMVDIHPDPQLIDWLKRVT